MPWLMEAIFIATGFTGALTLRWLFGLLFSRSGSASVTPHFLPAGGGTATVVEAIAAAKSEVLVLANGFACRPVAQALVDARLRGVSVEVILDVGNETDPGSELHFLVEQGLPPMLDDQHAVSRNDVVIDGTHVFAGSFTFAPQAEVDGTENLVVVRGDAGAAGAYRRDFLAHKAHARAVPAKTAATPELAPTQDQVVAAVAETLAEEPPAQPVVTQASSDLLARLRQELGNAGEGTEKPRDKGKKKAG
ncbi:MAG: phospholipase D-like domain-containing protein [Gemmataceae bacterium]